MNKIVPIISLFSAIFLSCNSYVHRNCHVILPAFRKNISIDQWNSRFDFWKGGSIQHFDSSYYLAITKDEVDSTVVKNWLQHYQINDATIRANNAIRFVMYAKGFADSDSVVTDSGLIGISVYYVRNGKLFSKVFKRKASVMIEIPELNLEVRTVATMDFYKTSKILSEGKTETLMAFAVDTKTFSTAEIKEIRERSKGVETEKLDDYLRKMNSVN